MPLYNPQPWQEQFPGSLILACPAALQPLAYMCVHASSVVIFSGPGYLFWHSFWLHTAFLVLMTLKAVHNGSHYVFEIFSTRYATALVVGKDQ